MEKKKRKLASNRGSGERSLKVFRRIHLFHFCWFGLVPAALSHFIPVSDEPKGIITMCIFWPDESCHHSSPCFKGESIANNLLACRPHSLHYRIIIHRTGSGSLLHPLILILILNT